MRWTCVAGKRSRIPICIVPPCTPGGRHRLVVVVGVENYKGGDAGVGQVRVGEQRREDERRQTIFDEREPRRTSSEATSERGVGVGGGWGVSVASSSAGVRGWRGAARVSGRSGAAKGHQERQVSRAELTGRKSERPRLHLSAAANGSSRRSRQQTANCWLTVPDPPSTPFSPPPPPPPPPPTSRLAADRHPSERGCHFFSFQMFFFSCIAICLYCTFRPPPQHTSRRPSSASMRHTWPLWRM